jgi:hypothetical protein
VSQESHAAPSATPGRLTVKRILRLYRGGTGILKIGKALGIGTALVQRIVTAGKLCI